MYGFPRLRADLSSDLAGSELLDELLERLHAFTGPGWEQEDDITLVALRRSAGAESSADPSRPADERTLLTLELPGAPGNERIAMARVAEAVAPLGLDPARLERLKTAVSEATMNAIEYGSGSDPHVPVEISVASADGQLHVRITDRALGGPIPGEDAEQPDLEAKLAGFQKARGWGLFLIRNMVDRVDVTPGDGRQTVTLTLALEGGNDERESA
jgi:anti-sigma regulatory factor (Ser/Thr protein kinase)